MTSSDHSDFAVEISSRDHEGEGSMHSEQTGNRLDDRVLPFCPLLIAKALMTSTIS